MYDSQSPVSHDIKTSSICNQVFVKSTVINMILNVSDLMENKAKTITNTIVQSPFSNIYETSYIHNGLLVLVWAMTCEKILR